MQRRLTTIVAADVAGYSRLIGLDEEGTLAALRGHREALIDPLLEQHGGRIANTAGDSLLIEFPSAVEAARCAMAVQRGMAGRNAQVPEDRRIEFRVGINVGDVVDQDGDLLGDGVNIAARLEAQAPPGGIVLSRAVRDQIRDRLDVNLADLGEIEVKNIARPVRAFQIVAEGEVAAPLPRRQRPWLAPVAAVLLLAVLAVGGVFLFYDTSGGNDASELAYSLPDRPSVVVLPFENLSGDQDQQYFVEGFDGAIRALLAKFPQLFVIARSTSGKLGGKDISLADIRRELAVAYAVRGAVRSGNGSLTVDAELIDTATSQTVWAEQYDMPERKIFELQADMTSRIVGSLHAAIEKDAIARVLKLPETNLEAYNLFLLAQARDKTPGADARREAIRLLQKAIELEPDFLDAHLMLSDLYLRFWRFGGTEDREESRRLARVHANRALEIDRIDYRVHFRLGMLHLFADHRHDLAYDAMSRAIRDNPNDAYMLYHMGFLRSLMGDGAEGLEWNNRAKRINPRYPGWYDFNAAMCHRMIGDFETAIRIARAGIASYPKAPPPRRILIAALVENGQVGEARAEAEAFLNLYPNFRLSTYRNTPFQHQEDQARYHDAMRSAGLPD